MNDDTNADQQVITRIEQLMASPPEHSVVLDITPAVALHILQTWRGTHNRDEKSVAIRRYAKDMAIGEWLLNGSTIVFTDQHLLGDGQNRLKACVGAGRAFRTHVIFGVPHAFFFSMDQGRVRTPADLLKIEGLSRKDNQIVAQAVRWAELLETGKVIHRTVFTAPHILKLYRERHDGVRDFIKEARAIYRLNRQPLGLVMAMLYTFNKIDPQAAADFAEAWEVGTYEPRFRAIGTMQTEIERIKRQSTGRVHEVVRAAMIVNAWNAVRAGYKGKASIIRWEMPTREQPTTFPTIA